MLTKEFIKELNNCIDGPTRNKLFVEKLGVDVLKIDEYGIPEIGAPAQKIPNPKNWKNPDSQPPITPGMTGDDYLRHVNGSADPYPIHLIEHEGVMVLRDDLLPNGLGSKVRCVEALMQDIKQDIIFYAMPGSGQAGIVLSQVAKQHNKLVVLIIREQKSNPTQTHFNAMKNGAVVLAYNVKSNMANEHRKRCRDFITEYIGEENGIYLAAGLKNEKIVGGFVRAARNIDFKPDIVISVASTMVMNSSLQLAWPDAEVYAIQVAGNNASRKWPGRAIVKNHEQAFGEECLPEHLPPFNSIRTYDAKAWKYVREIREANPGKKILFWNVAGEVTHD